MLNRGIDVRECFGPAHQRKRDWRTIWRFKDLGLPRGSLYKSALLMDPELAAQIIANEPDDPDMSGSVMTPEGWTTETYLFAAAIDAIQNVSAAVIAAAGADPPSIQPMPRPVTALDEVREARRLAGMQNLIDIFTPRPIGPA